MSIRMDWGGKAWRRRSALVLGAALAAASLAAQPAINSGGVVNAASNAPPGLPNSAIAQGSIFVVYGTGLGPAALAQAGYPLPTTLGGTSGTTGTSLKVTVKGIAEQCPLVYTSASQVAAILPSSTPAGSGTLVVSFNGQDSAPQPVQVRASGFGIFTLNEAGSGPAVVTNASGQVITLTNAGQPGETLILYGTGLGAIHASDGSAPPVGDIGAAPAVYVGTEKAVVTYHGRSPCCAGLDQINFIVPQSASGCYVPVAVEAGNTPSNFASIAVANTGKVCSDANGLASSQLQLLASGKNVRLGSLHLVRSMSMNLPPPSPFRTMTNDIGDAAFMFYTPRQLESSLGPFRTASVGGCIVFVLSSSSQDVADPVMPKGLDAGAAISLSGPNGVKMVRGSEGLPGFYSSILGSTNTPPLYLDPGTYTFSVAGGADIGAFQSQLQVPKAVTWTNASSLLTVHRAEGVTVTWNGGESGGFVYIFGYSLASPSGPDSTSTGAEFFSASPADAGQFTVPSVVLSALPQTGSVAGFQSLLGGMGLTSVSPPVSFTAPGIDVGIATASSSVSQPTIFR